MDGGILSLMHRSHTVKHDAVPFSHRILQAFLQGSARFELRQRDAVAAVFEDGLHRHVDLYLLDRAADDGGAQTWTVVEIEPRGAIGNVRSKAAPCGPGALTIQRRESPRRCSRNSCRS